MNSQFRADGAPLAAFPDINGRYGSFGGRYVSETLVPALDRLPAGVTRHLNDPDFQAEFTQGLKTWGAVGLLGVEAGGRGRGFGGRLRVGDGRRSSGCARGMRQG